MLLSRYWCRRLTIIFILSWFAILLYVIDPLWKASENQEALRNKLIQANRELKVLENKNNELQDLLEGIEKQLETYIMAQNNNSEKVSLESEYVNIIYSNLKRGPKIRYSQEMAKDVNAPTKEYELTRRRLFRDMNEFWWYIQENIKSGLKCTDIPALLNKTLFEGQHRHNSLLAVLDELSKVDGFKTWRENEAKELSDLVQKRLFALQNPEDCSTARKLICNFNKLCGFGCQLHHAVYCFIVAYGTERTLILNSKGWRYNSGGFEEVFKPLSETCVLDYYAYTKGKRRWPGNDDTRVVEIPFIENIKPLPEFLPPAIPEDLADRIVRLHGDPIVWWVAQFLKYMLRPQDNTVQFLNEMEGDRDLKQPMVGIHIRRTDKLDKEAGFHDVEEYMIYVKEYFQQLEINTGSIVSPKLVYVASDDPHVLSECITKFPDYTFLGDQSIAQSAAVHSRYNIKSLQGIISDIHMLSLSDFIVCTFSSQVCRLAYEIQQQRYVDGFWRFKSLDDIWYYGNQDHQQEAILPHIPNNNDGEMSLKVGDIISVAGNHWNGYNKGRNHANEQIGLYPLYKTREKFKVVAFPTYPNVRL